MSLFSSAMSRGEVNNREVIRLPRAAIGGGGATTMAGAERDIAGGRSGVEGFSSWWQAAAAA